jgi:hypothetical protein
MNYGYFVECRPKGGYWKHSFRRLFGKHRPDWEAFGSIYSCPNTAKRQAAQLASKPKNAGYQFRVAGWLRVAEERLDV